ncbi:ECF RNA polymerase sigma factor SigW [Planctomycetes bacterium CA13]|uniref:ECF RNA polymerase sigma factor SigW n=1 Tax=Novipirellula herctigrandis TaxID=2527986 RepID=A0A5C5Z714_9BACT|nr:ECF RNA polymerase sigma factor SigW [Planctomycetes bacterium CA13]
MNQQQRLHNEILVIQAQQGATESLEQLIQCWQDRLWRLAWRLTDNEQAAWDVTQESWFIISRRIDRLEDPSAFSAWAYRITSNKSRDWIRRQQRVRRADDTYAESREETQCHQVNQQAEKLSDALASLSGHDRAVLSLRYEDDFSISEIAEILRIPSGTVKSRLHHARGRLRHLIEDTKDE